METKKDTIISLKTILLGIISCIFIFFCILNFSQVNVNLLFAKISAPLVIVILLSYGMGTLVTWILLSKHK